MHAQKQHLRKCWDKQQRCKARQQGKTIRDLRKFRHLLSLLEAYVWQLRRRRCSCQEKMGVPDEAFKACVVNVKITWLMTNEASVYVKIRLSQVCKSPLDAYMKMSSRYILQTFSFCVPQKKESNLGLELHEGE